jgi:hypothetical protein
VSVRTLIEAWATAVATGHELSARNVDAGCITDIRRRALVPRLYWAVDEGSVPVRTLDLLCLRPDGNDLIVRKQTHHLDVVNAIGGRRDTGYRGCRSGIGVNNDQRAGTFGNGAIHGNQLAASGCDELLDGFATVGVWVFPHGLEGVRV